MTRIKPLTDEEIGNSIDYLKPTIERLGFLPNSQRIMARKPELLIGINELYKAIRSDGGIRPPGRYLVVCIDLAAVACIVSPIPAVLPTIPAKTPPRSPRSGSSRPATCLPRRAALRFCTGSVFDP